MLPLLQEGVKRESLNDYCLGLILEALFAANLHCVFGALALKALAVYSIETPWRHHDTTPLSLYGAYEASEAGCETAVHESEAPVVPRPAYGHSKDRRSDLKQVVLSLGVGGEGSVPLRLGIRDGNTHDSTEMPVAIAECLNRSTRH
jgi:transposase